MYNELCLKRTGENGGIPGTAGVWFKGRYGESVWLGTCRAVLFRYGTPTQSSLLLLGEKKERVNERSLTFLKMKSGLIVTTIFGPLLFEYDVYFDAAIDNVMLMRSKDFFFLSLPLTIVLVRPPLVCRVDRMAMASMLCSFFPWNLRLSLATPTWFFFLIPANHLKLIFFTRKSCCTQKQNFI